MNDTLHKYLDSKCVWDTLSKIDCNEHKQKVGKFDYLSWSWAWATLMNHYPQATYEFHEPKIQADGTVTVFCTVKIDEQSRMMWLPVMDYKNKAVVNPDARQLNDSMMRCLVKCLAMYGLGHYIYAGEDIPSQEKDTISKKSVKKEANENETPPEHKKNEVKESIGDDIQKLKDNLKSGNLKNITNGTEKLGQSI
jgi:hypothetical protein